MCMVKLLVGAAFLLVFPAIVWAEEPNDGDSESARESTQALVARLKKSLVTIRSVGRAGDELAMGTGFVIDEAGLIATNFHVIGEGRPLRVEFGNRQFLQVKAIEASSRHEDLAILRVDPGKQKLTALPLAQGPILEAGTAVLALGNPLGLKHSVTQGIVSAVREIEGHELIQVAIPIEPGNSGGPLVDLSGTVHGIVNMKSTMKANIGFAIPIAELKELADSPNPILIDRWINMSAFDAKRWNSIMGGDWQERSSVMRVTSGGNGFGGRAVCLSRSAVPPSKFEVAVDVKLDDDSGAAGLVFHSDGSDRHYGFYPSKGKMRLVCFLGANVMSWQIIREVDTVAYRPGEWNRLRIACDGEHIQGFVNESLVVDERHRGLRSGAVGLAAYRGTTAQFRRFEVGESLMERDLANESIDWIAQVAAGKSESPHQELRSLPRLDHEGIELARRLELEAEELDRRAGSLRRMAADAVLLPVIEKIQRSVESDEPNGLLEGALLIAALDHPDLDVPSYIARVDAMAEEIRSQISESATDADRLAALDKYLFEQNGYRGGHEEYYHPANNHLDRVIDDREGMPITLSVLYMELGRRLGLKLDGVGLPGRFVVRHRGEDERILDIFDKAKPLSESDVAMMVMVHSERLVTEDDLRPQRTIEILTRILTNLIGSAKRNGDVESMYRYSEGMVALYPDVPEQRLMRGINRFQTERFDGAVEDLDWVIENPPEGLDVEELIALRTEAAKQ